MSKYKYNTFAEQWSQWSHKGFHLSLFLLVTLFTLVAILIKQESVKMVKPVLAEYKPLISPLPLVLPTPLSLPSPTPNYVVGRILPKDRVVWQQIVDAIDRVLPLYNATKVRNVVLAQAAHESGVHTDHGLSDFCLYRHNCLGIAAYTESPNSALVFENYEQMVIGYFEKSIRIYFPEAWSVKDKNPDLFLYYLEHNSNGSQYATDENYINLVKNQPEWSQSD